MRSQVFKKDMVIWRLIPVLVMLGSILGFGQTPDTTHNESPDPICAEFADVPRHHVEMFGTLRFTTDLVAHSSADGAQDFPPCKFEVTTLSGDVVARGEDLFIMPLKYADVDGDGLPELIIRTESGGSAGCATLHFVQVDPPKLLKSISGCEGLDVKDVNHDGRPVIVAHDGFDLPETDCHTCQPNVPVFLRFDGDKLHNVSSEFQAQYDAVIDNLRNQLRPKYLEALVSARNEQEILFLPGFKTAGDAEVDGEPFDELASDAHIYVLRIVVYYLFSGREQLAWQTLNEMWPMWDQQRMKEKILKRLDESRREDILKYVSR